jgi:hypothetical protein
VAGLDFPHATQALRVTRRIRPLHGQRWRTVTVYAVTTSPPPRTAPPAWPTGSGATGVSRRCTTSAMSPLPRTPARSAPAPPPRAMASLRNLAIAILRLRGWRNIAAALRRNARDAIRVLPLLGITSP